MKIKRRVLKNCWSVSPKYRQQSEQSVWCGKKPIVDMQPTNTDDTHFKVPTLTLSRPSEWQHDLRQGTCLPIYMYDQGAALLCTHRCGKPKLLVSILPMTPYFLGNFLFKYLILLSHYTSFCNKSLIDTSLSFLFITVSNPSGESRNTKNFHQNILKFKCFKFW